MENKINPDSILEQMKFDKEQIEILEGYLDKKIPSTRPKALEDFFKLNSFSFRQAVVKKQGYAFLTQEFVDELAKWIGSRKCLEIMAGVGSLSYCLQQKGIDVIPIDNKSFHMNGSWSSWCDIENIDCIEAIEKYGKDVDIMIVSWGEMSSTTYKAIKRLNELNPQCIVVAIGEGEGGCTFDDNFFHNIEYIDDSKFNKVISSFVSFQAIHDKPFLCKYKKGGTEEKRFYMFT